MKEPYFNGQTAEPIWKIEDLQPVVTQADAAGLQIAIHAIGEYSLLQTTLNSVYSPLRNTFRHGRRGCRI